MHPPALKIPPKIPVLAPCLMLATFWLLMRGYHGLTGDAQLYAFQALARVHPPLAADLYLQNTSQDQFTLFSPFYAAWIRLLGLESAARLLTLLFTVWLLAAAWRLVREVTGRDGAWLGIASLLIVAGEYGGSGVFRFSEAFLTARLPAECLVITALALHFQGLRRWALGLAIGAIFIHPLIALPGVLVLLCMGVPARWGVAAAIGGVLVAGAAALLASVLPAGTAVFTVMDAAWLDIVKERSQFLLLPLWSAQDWELNIQPLLFLAFMVMTLPDPRIRTLCSAAALVGAAGLAVAWIGSAIGPVAILVQGQAWRWIWVAVFVSAVLLPATARQVWRDPTCGALCAVLLVAGLTLPTAVGTLCVSCALVLWCLRGDMGPRAIPYLRCACAGLIIAVAIWIVIEGWGVASSRSAPAGSVPAQVVRDLFGLRIPAVLLIGTVGWMRRRKHGLPALASLLLAALSIAVWPAAFKQSHVFAAAAAIEEFADWRGAIPAASTVLVAPAQDVGGFVWFTLGRPNYLALDQSAGVVFSRNTALEVRRRSEVLLPLMDPNWMILTQLMRSSSGRKEEAPSRPLTKNSLLEVCGDPTLGFVASPVRLEFPALRHAHAGAWKDWNLYDCTAVRSAAAAPPPSASAPAARTGSPT